MTGGCHSTIRQACSRAIDARYILVARATLSAPALSRVHGVYPARTRYASNSMRITSQGQAQEEGASPPVRLSGLALQQPSRAVQRRRSVGSESRLFTSSAPHRAYHTALPVKQPRSPHSRRSGSPDCSHLERCVQMRIRRRLCASRATAHRSAARLLTSSTP